MMFSENVSAELQEILELELHRYKREIGHMTNEEWNLLVDWVYSGHSPYMNGDGVFDDDGWPLDYISTFRSWQAMMEEGPCIDPDCTDMQSEDNSWGFLDSDTPF
ncbi:MULTISPECIES: hypothetical protein [unclassified Butyrivibrio]|uniref:hypothetical protein n=3 Tax=Butyrivibrio TaxID=830 RepID=UPI000478EF69|nr:MULTISPECIES: hypothetical protein [unclassified Butyrivibrio]MBQ9304681.1 hypothetical protein [Butyrivibrio sp.]